MNIGSGKIIHSTVVIALSMSVGAIFGIAATAHAKATEAICHWDDSAGAWELEVLSPRAAEKHLENHELDGVPGGVVPGTLGAMCTDSCRTCFDSNP
jgi:hypothetical protein